MATLLLRDVRKMLLLSMGTERRSERDPIDDAMGEICSDVKPRRRRLGTRAAAAARNSADLPFFLLLSAWDSAPKEVERWQFTSVAAPFSVVKDRTGPALAGSGSGVKGEMNESADSPVV